MELVITIWIVIIIIAGILDFWEIIYNKIVKGKKDKYINNEYSHKIEWVKIKNIFTQSERIFYRKLKENFYNYDIFCKIRLVDFININTWDKNRDFWLFQKTNKKHIDFLLCDENWNIFVAIELDWYSHNYKKQIESDKFKDDLFKQFNINLIRFKVWTDRDFEELKKSII